MLETLDSLGKTKTAKITVKTVKVIQLVLLFLLEGARIQSEKGDSYYSDSISLSLFSNTSGAKYISIGSFFLAGLINPFKN